MSSIEVRHSDGGRVATLRLLREAKRNALDGPTIEQLHDAALKLRKERDLAVVVLTGGPRAFSAGADRDDASIFGADTPLMEKRHNALLGSDMARAWQALPQVTIAAIEGYAVGGGLTLAMACDFRVCGRSSFLWVPEVDIGANYGWSSVPRLVSLAGPAAARRMILLAERIGAEQARQWGLVDEVVDDGEAEAKAMAMAVGLAAKPRMALAVSKRAINAVAGALTEIASHGDMEQVLLCFSDFAQSRDQQKKG